MEDQHFKSGLMNEGLILNFGAARLVDGTRVFSVTSVVLGDLCGRRKSSPEADASHVAPALAPAFPENLKKAAGWIAVAVGLACQPAGDGTHENAIIDLWMEGTTTFGVFVPNERVLTPEQRRSPDRPGPLYTVDGGRALAENPLYDFVFLNLEGGYDPEAVRTIAEGLRAPSAVSRKTLLVRIPPIATDGEDVTRIRIREILGMGADGVVFPHVRSPEEAGLAISFFADAGANVWSPANPDGETIAMIMVEDPDALARITEFADLPGYSVLACGIGSLTRALDGDREAAEAGNQRVLDEATRVGLPDMITANTANVEQRIQQGFLALLMSGPNGDDVIRTGRAAVGR